jgi:hypothetical protein
MDDEIRNVYENCNNRVKILIGSEEFKPGNSIKE